MMAKMKIRFINGINTQSVHVDIENDGEIKYSNVYTYGENASHSREFADIALRNHINAEKFGWKNSYPLKPFIGDILRDLAETFYIKNGEFEYSGFNIFNKKEMTPEEVQIKVGVILEEI